MRCSWLSPPVTTLSSSRPPERFWNVPAICAARNGEISPGPERDQELQPLRDAAEHRGGDPGVLAPRAGRGERGLEAELLGAAGDLPEVGDGGRAGRTAPAGDAVPAADDVPAVAAVGGQEPVEGQLGHLSHNCPWLGGREPSTAHRPRCWTFQAAGSCRVWVRALRQCRSRFEPRGAERVPATSNSRLPACSGGRGRGRARRGDGEARRAGRGSPVRCGVRGVDRRGRLAQQRLGRPDREFEFAERVHDERVLGRALDAGVRVGPADVADEARPPRSRRRGRCRRRWPRAAPGRTRRRSAGPSKVTAYGVINSSGTATSVRITLPLAVVRWPEPVPVVDDLDAGRVPFDPGDVQRAVDAEVRQHRDPVGEQRAGGVELASVQPPAAGAVRRSAWCGCRGRAWCPPRTARCRTACRPAPRRTGAPAAPACPCNRSWLT